MRRPRSPCRRREHAQARVGRAAAPAASGARYSAALRSRWSHSGAMRSKHVPDRAPKQRPQHRGVGDDRVHRSPEQLYPARGERWPAELEAMPAMIPAGAGACLPGRLDHLALPPLLRGAPQSLALALCRRPAAGGVRRRRRRRAGVRRVRGVRRGRQAQPEAGRVPEAQRAALGPRLGGGEDQLRRLHDRARHRARPEDHLVVRGAGRAGPLRRHPDPPDRARLRDPGRRPQRRRHRRPRLLRRRAAARRT